MKNPRSGSGDVFRDAGFSPEEAVELRFKAELYQAVLVCARQYKPKDLEILFHEPQPRVSELLNGKIANKSIEKLLWYAGKLGIVPKFKFPQLRKHEIERKLEEGPALAR
jgi:predicted XRE-type DNA-binding protein